MYFGMIVIAAVLAAIVWKRGTFWAMLSDLLDPAARRRIVARRSREAADAVQQRMEQAQARRAEEHIAAAHANREAIPPSPPLPQGIDWDALSAVLLAERDASALPLPTSTALAQLRHDVRWLAAHPLSIDPVEAQRMALAYLEDRYGRLSPAAQSAAWGIFTDT